MRRSAPLSYAADELRGAPRNRRETSIAEDNGAVNRRASLSRHFADGASRDRTGDLLLAKQALSQLSYGPVAYGS
jgi:hypothetical protein